MTRVVKAIRIEKGLIEQLRKEAKEANRSLNNHIETILLNRYKSREENDEKTVP